MKLYLIRHATAADHFGGNIKSDAERPLTDSGRKEAHAVAVALKRLGVKPNLFLTSPLIRARQTAVIFADLFSLSDKVKLTEALAPGGRASDLYAQIRLSKNVDEICLFGHQPDLTELAQALLLSGPELEMPFKKAGACRIDIYDCPPTSPGTLKWLITPKIAQCMAEK